MARMTNFRSAAIATGNAINDSAYDNVKKVADNIDSVGEAATGRTNITYGSGSPTNNINPVTGTNAIYIDTDNDGIYICYDATKNSNIWIKSTSGQFLGNSKVGSIMFSSQTTSEHLVLPDGQNGLIFDNLAIEGDGSIEIQGNAVLVTI